MLQLSKEDIMRELFTDSYWILPLIGSIFGFTTSRRWGGLSSVFGRSVFFFSLGLFMQVFGQVVYSVYAIWGGVEVPYPSLGDIGFFGSIPLYILGLLQLGRTLNLSKALHEKKNVALVGTVIITLLSATYFVFLNNYDLDFSNVVTMFFDFGYPLGQSLYIGIAVLIYLLSVQTLGGKMRARVLFLLLAMGFQYFADFIFLYRQSRGYWIEGGVSDVLYLIAYFIMGVSLVLLDHDLKK